MNRSPLARAGMYLRLSDGQDDAVPQLSLSRKAGMVLLTVLFLMATPLYFSAVALGSEDGGSSAATLVKSGSDDDDEAASSGGGCLGQAAGARGLAGLLAALLAAARRR